ncbi:MAG: hypothetical protein ACPGXK_12500, partial [Phycisphaerae bacterium]
MSSARSPISGESSGDSKTLDVAKLRHDLRKNGTLRESFQHSLNERSISNDGLFGTMPDLAGLEGRIRNSVLGAVWLKDLLAEPAYEAWLRTYADSSDTLIQSHPMTSGGPLTVVEWRRMGQQLRAMFREAEIWATLAALEGGEFPSRGLDRALRQWLWGLRLIEDNGFPDFVSHRPGHDWRAELHFAWHDSYDILRSVRKGATDFLAQRIRCNRGKRHVLFHSLAHMRSWQKIPFVPPIGCQCIDEPQISRKRGTPEILEDLPTMTGGMTSISFHEGAFLALSRGEEDAASILIKSCQLVLERSGTDEQWTIDDIQWLDLYRQGEAGLGLVGRAGPFEVVWIAGLHPSGSYVSLDVEIVATDGLPWHGHLGIAPTYVNAPGSDGRIRYDGGPWIQAGDVKQSLAVRRWVRTSSVNEGESKRDGVAAAFDTPRNVTRSGDGSLQVELRASLPENARRGETPMTSGAEFATPRDRISLALIPGASVSSVALLNRVVRDVRHPWRVVEQSVPMPNAPMERPLPPSVMFLEVSDPDIELLALKPVGFPHYDRSPSSRYRTTSLPDEVVIRLHNPTDTLRRCGVRLRHFSGEAWRANILEQKQGVLPAEDGIIQVDLKAGAVETIVATVRPHRRANKPENFYRPASLAVNASEWSSGYGESHVGEGVITLQKSFGRGGDAAIGSTHVEIINQHCLRPVEITLDFVRPPGVVTDFESGQTFKLDPGSSKHVTFSKS